MPNNQRSTTRSTNGCERTVTFAAKPRLATARIHRAKRPLAGFLLIILCGPAVAQDELAERLRYRLETTTTTDSLQVLDERLMARQTLRRLYTDNGYQPLWVSRDGPGTAAVRFKDWLQTEPERHGLRPENYHAEVLDVLDEQDRLAAMVDLELALSDGFLLVASHLLAGQLNPETLDAEWRANRRHRDLVPVLLQAAGDDPAAALEDLMPLDPAYHRLVDRLAALRRLRTAGGWAQIPAGPAIRAGDSHERVASVARRLIASGDFSGPETDDFSSDLVAAVRRFQARHGLEADGVIGKATVASLNATVQERIDQLIVNMERWRWLPEDLGERHVLVNIAGFSLDVVDSGQRILSMRVIVGRPYRRTPVFSDRISYLVLNPYWEVPTSIAVRDKLPLIRQDPGYLQKHGYTLLSGWGANERVVDPAMVLWENVTSRSFGYRLRQSPGAANALGRVKFMFPNQFSVYLHDTPSRELFALDARSFSSGCIRLEHPLELAEVLLNDSSRWSRSDLERILASGKERTVTLPTKVPVHLLYWTTWVGEDDEIQFRNDIYGRDARVLDKLRTPAPGS